MKKTIITILAVMLIPELQAQYPAAYSNSDFIIVNAKFTNKETGNPAKGIRGYLSIPGAVFTFTSAISDSLGNIVFLIKKPSTASFIIQTDIKDNNLNIESGRPFTVRYEIPRIKNDGNYIRDNTPFYGTPDKVYYLDAYTRFSTIEEILIEYVPEIKLKKQKNGFHFEVFNYPYKTFFSEEPLVLLDGVPVFDPNKLMTIDPRNIKKMEIITRKYYLGSLNCYGIVSFTTYDNKLGGYALPANALAMEYNP